MRVFPSAAAPTLATIAGGTFRRSLFGYRRGEVDAALGVLESELGRSEEIRRGREAEAERLNAELGVLGRRLEAGEAEIASLRAELASARVRADEELRSLTVLGRQLEELSVGARGQATRIRLRALREAAELSARLSYATGETGERQRQRILEALEEAIGRVAGDWESEIPAPPLSRGPAPAAAGGNGRPSAADRRRVSVDVGPFEDFSQLVRFEDAANAIGATGDISIKRFSGGRARIDVALSEPVDLLRELEERCDLEFKVRSTSDDEIVLDVDDAA